MQQDTLIGQRLDEYHLQALLGQGGSARVYRALDTRLKRWVAVKVIDKPFRADADYTTRFEREARAIAQLDHPNIVGLYRYGESNGLLYMALQYIEGATLHQVLSSYRQEGTFIETEEACRLIGQICAALDYAHSKGVIHRDIKPSNIIVNQQGDAVLVDFGLALLADTRTMGDAFGTAEYMAPEQVTGVSRSTPQTDLYAVGVILYEMFAGRPPFEAKGKRPMDVAEMHVNEPPPRLRTFRPDLHRAVEAVILKALVKIPEARYADGAALSRALNRAVSLTDSLPTASQQAKDLHQTISARVAKEVGQHPLPPLPNQGVDRSAKLHETQPAIPQPPPPRATASKRRDATKLKPAVKTAEPPPAEKKSALFSGKLMAGLLAVLLVLCSLSLWFIFQSPDERQNPVVVQPTSAPTSAPEPTATPQPPEPQLVAGSRRDFSGSPSNGWQYLVSRPNQNNFEAMIFENGEFGQCWYPNRNFNERYVRICENSGHPGNEADIAWRWRSDLNGRVRVVGTARKIDSGGDGVLIQAYHNGQFVDELSLKGGDTDGVRERNWFVVDVAADDTLTFVMKSNGRVENDHTTLNIEIYRS
ncbi:MAG: serine/threonine protein kinase [Anaerolineae bacterium]|nr:serine/threonine protein kinase [Anaerolineae bacterium]